VAAKGSERRFYLAVLGPFVLAIAALALVFVVGFSVLSAARAYVAGESLWSKGRSAAIAALRAYAMYGHDADYLRFEAALAVPLGDRQARLALDRDEPDLAAARAGFATGANAAEDIEAMIRLFRYGRHVSFMRDAITAWAQGDVLIDELRDLGAALRESRFRPGSSAANATPAVQARIDTIERALIDAERQFTGSLGRASRLTERLLVAVTLVLATVLALLIALFVQRTLRVQVEDRRLIGDANRRWALAADAAGVGLFEWRRGDDRYRLDARARAILRVEGDAAGVVDSAVLAQRVHPEDLDAVGRSWAAALAGADLFHHRYRLRPPVGSERWIDATAMVRDRDVPGGPSVIGIVRDITDEAALARVTLEKQAAERVSKARVDFLSRLSHELRTPLNAVLGLAQLLRIDAGERLTPAQDRRVAIIIDSGQQLLRLVEDVLDITRIDSGSVALDLQPTDVQASLRASLHLVEPERAAFGIRIENRLPSHAGKVRADSQRLQQVFVNLLSNGCKYNRRDGALRVDAREEGPWLHVDFADEGLGLDEAQRAELFQPFKRLAPTAQVGGTGLGLVVVKLLVEQMNGRIDVRSGPGQGCCFTVSLPKA
jgi:signal transduction histidine kinase